MRLLRAVNIHHGANGSALASPSMLDDGHNMSGLWPEDLDGFPSPGLRRAPRFLRLRRMGRRLVRTIRRPTITIDIDDGIGRVVILEGREVVAWGTSVLGPKDGEEEPAPLGAGSGSELRALLTHLPYQDGRVVTSLPVKACLVRRLELPRMNRRYLEQVILSEVLESIPLTEAEADIAWQHRKVGPGHDVVAVAAPKEAVDKHVALLNGAGCRPAAAYPRVLALAFAAGHQNVIVVDLGLFSAVVVAVRSGMPFLVHRLEYPESNHSSSQKAEAVARTMEQAADHFHTMGGQVEMGMGGVAEAPAVLTGQLADDPSLVESIEEFVGRRVIPCSSLFEYPEYFPAREYAANLGLAIADQSRPRARASSSPRVSTCVNALPVRHMPPTLPILPAALLLLVIILGYLAFVVAGRLEGIASERDALSSDIATAERQARSYRLTIARGGTIEKRIEDAERLEVMLESQASALDTKINAMIAQLDSITEEASSTRAQVITLFLQGRNFLLTGTAPAYEDVVQFAEQLRGSGLFNDVRVLRVDASGGGGDSGATTEPVAGSVSYRIEVTTAQGPEED